MRSGLFVLLGVAACAAPDGPSRPAATYRYQLDRGRPAATSLAIEPGGRVIERFALPDGARAATLVAIEVGWTQPGRATIAVGDVVVAVTVTAGMTGPLDGAPRWTTVAIDPPARVGATFEVVIGGDAGVGAVAAPDAELFVQSARGRRRRAPYTPYIRPLLADVR